MIRVFTGSDRKKIDAEVKKILGENYEVFDGENLKLEDIVNIFLGTSLFSEKRKRFDAGAWSGKWGERRWQCRFL